MVKLKYVILDRAAWCKIRWQIFESFARSEGYYPSELTSGKYSAKLDMYSYGAVSLHDCVGISTLKLPKCLGHVRNGEVFLPR
jgi:serine/threonine protein kinase